MALPSRQRRRRYAVRSEFLGAEGRAPFAVVAWTLGEWVDADGAQACRLGVRTTVQAPVEICWGTIG